MCVAHSSLTESMATLYFLFTSPKALWKLKFQNTERDYPPNRSKIEQQWQNPLILTFSHCTANVFSIITAVHSDPLTPAQLQCISLSRK